MQHQMSFQDLLSGRMCLEPSAATKEKISKRCSKPSVISLGGGTTVPGPHGGKWKHAGCIVGDGFSIAWRLYDAQYWGVPQRRKRIYLIADFASERAGEILFESKGVCWDSETSRKAWENVAKYVDGCPDGGSQVRWM